MNQGNSPSEQTVTAYKIPVSVIAGWPPPNTVNPETRQWLGPVAIVLQFLTTVALCGRVWARYSKQAGAFGLDDALITAAWLFSVMFVILVTYGVYQAGFDRHAWDLLPFPDLVEHGALITWISEGAFLMSSCFTKISILLFYKRLMARSYSRMSQWAIYTAIIFTVIYLLVFMIFLVVACTPVDAAWKSMRTDYKVPYKCANRAVVDPLVGALSVFSDIYTLLLPEMIIRKLQMGRRQKIILYSIFSVGILVVGAGLARTYYLARLSSDPKHDVPWNGHDVLFWSLVEMDVAIICASAPALKIYVARFLIEPLQKATRSYGLSRGDGPAGVTESTSNITHALFSRSTHEDGSSGKSEVEKDNGGFELLKIEKSFKVETRYSEVSMSGFKPEAPKAFIQAIPETEREREFDSYGRGPGRI